MPGGHASHQTGIDVDIWFLRTDRIGKAVLTLDERENLSAPSVLTTDPTPRLDKARWNQDETTVLRLAAELPDERDVRRQAVLRHAAAVVRAAREERQEVAAVAGRVDLAGRPVQFEHEFLAVDLVHMDANLVKPKGANDRQRGYVARGDRRAEVVDALRLGPGEERPDTLGDDPPAPERGLTR